VTMASVVNDPNGRKRIQFVDGNNERKSIRLGKATVKAAESFRLRVEALLADKALGRPHDAELCEWLNQRPDKVYERLARVGLVPPPHPQGGSHAGKPAGPLRGRGRGEAGDTGGL